MSRGAVPETAVSVEFCGELFPATPGEPLVIGREGDIEVDDNPYLHRSFLHVEHDAGRRPGPAVVAEPGLVPRAGGPEEGGDRQGQGWERQDRGPKGKPRFDKGKPRHEGPKTFEARPPRPEKKVDPDSPFAILASLKNKT